MYMLFVTNGQTISEFDKPQIKNAPVKTIAKTVLTKNTEMARCKLLITRLPSLTTAGSEEN